MRNILARLYKTHTAWTTRFLAVPTVLGVADTSEIALSHPMREGRRPAQIGKKGKRNHRWMVGGKLCFILNQWGLICAWDCATANVHDTHCQPLIAQCDGQMIVVADTGLHAKSGDPAHMQGCPRGTWNTRMVVETVWSMLTTIFHSKQVGHRVWAFPRPRGMDHGGVQSLGPLGYGNSRACNVQADYTPAVVSARVAERVLRAAQSFVDAIEESYR